MSKVCDTIKKIEEHFLAVKDLANSNLNENLLKLKLDEFKRFFVKHTGGENSFCLLKAGHEFFIYLDRIVRIFNDGVFKMVSKNLKDQAALLQEFKEKQEALEQQLKQKD